MHRLVVRIALRKHVPLRAGVENPQHRFKDMINHGALDINYGRKKIVGPDRHQQRKREQLDASLETAQQRVDKKVEAREMKLANALCRYVEYARLHKQ